jgi:acetyl esterase/lipase
VKRDEVDRSFVDAAELNALLRREPWISREISQGLEGIRRVRRAMDRYKESPDAPKPTRVMDVGVPLRTFEIDSPSAVYISVHGGGWFAGSAEMDDVENAHKASACGVSVVSIDYRLVPEVTWQAVIDECTKVAKFVISDGPREFGASKVIFGGTSAGATICVQMLLRLRQEHLLDSVVGANLVYGSYDFGMTLANGVGRTHSFLTPITSRSRGPSSSPALRRKTAGTARYLRCTPTSQAFHQLCSPWDPSIPSLTTHSSWPDAGEPQETERQWRFTPSRLTDLPAFRRGWRQSSGPRPTLS